MNPRWLLAAVAALVAAPALAQDKKPLRWGTDPTGGAPYVYKDGNAFVGFEVELADYLAKELGRTSEMVTGDWDKLPELLGKPAGDPNGIDIVLNGYELREDLEKTYPSTVPYYVYRLGLVIHKDSAGDIAGWSDLRRAKAKGEKRSVGVLGGSAAHEYLKDEFGNAIDLKINPDVATVVGLVEEKRLDATVQDLPAATYYIKHGKDLVLGDEPRQPGYYVILTRASDKDLREQLNAAIKKGIKDGTLKTIYEKYGLWNDDQERLLYWTEQPWPPFKVAAEEGATKAGKADWGQMIGELLRAAVMTVYLAVVSFPIAMLIGLLVGLGRVYGPAWLRVPLGLYVEVLRGTPLLLQLYCVFYMLPQIDPHLALSPINAGILGLAINYSAYEAENYRAGIQSIPRGQMEAALALGMSPLTAIRVVIVPQAVRVVIPPVTNDFIALFKDTSVCSVILITELTRKYNELYNFNRDYIVQLAFVTAGLYLLMSYPMSLLARGLERRMGTNAAGGHR
ncbi:ABC transporter substrate-binding protein/permease [Gemmata sp.]|uniref:ABC transporter substrate-binding protein/permease n=1 Tax=Gemmata sp. TaxID=1914242 RepID=UPI003F6F7100